MKNATKNLYGPLSLIFVVPILLFSVLIKTNLISKNFFPNLTGAIIFAIFMIYGFLSIKLSKKRFTGPTNVDGVILGRALLEGKFTLEEAIACWQDA